MKRPLVIAATCASLALPAFLAAGCGGDDSGDDDAGRTETPQATTTNTSATTTTGSDTTSTRKRRRGTTIKVMSTRFGDILANRGGRAIYLFTREKGTRSRCYGKCAVAWPPVLTRAKPRSGTGTDKSLLGTTKRRDGKTQATYKGHPLYYYVGDNKPGQVLCQAVDEFGGIWYVVAPSGDAITTPE